MILYTYIYISTLTRETNASLSVSVCLSNGDPSIGIETNCFLLPKYFSFYFP